MPVGAGENFETRVSISGVSEHAAGMRQVANSYRRAAQDTKEAERANKRYEKSLDDIHGAAALMGGTIAAGGVLFGRSILQNLARIDSLKMGLQSMMGSAGRANAEIERLQTLATKPGIGYEEAMRMSLQLQAAGMSANEARVSIEQFGNALALAGGGKEQMSYVSLALTQIKTAGKVQGDELRQLQEHVPQIRKALKEAFGTADTAQLAKMGITSEDFFTKVTEQLSKLPRFAGGVQNSIDNLSDAWTRFLYGSGKSGRGGIIGGVDVVTKLLNGFNKLNDVTHGTAGFLVLAGTGLAIVGGAAITASYGVKKLRDMWIEVAAAAELADIAQHNATGGLSGGGGRGKGKGGGFGRTLINVGKQIASSLVDVATLGIGARLLSRGGTAGQLALPGMGARTGLVGRISGLGARGAAAAGLSGVGTVGGITAGGALGALGPAAAISEILDWGLGNTLGRLQKGGPSKRLGNGGWLPNFSPFRMIGAYYGAIGDWFGAGQSYVGTKLGAKSRWKSPEEKQAYLDWARSKQANSSPARTNSLLTDINGNLKKIVELNKDQNKTLFGGGKRTAVALSQGNIERAIAGTLANATIG